MSYFNYQPISIWSEQKHQPFISLLLFESRYVQIQYIIISNRMGTSSSFRRQPFEYYSDALDKNMGPVQVYTCKSLQMIFIMKLRHQNYDDALLNIYQTVAKQQSPFLVTMFGLKEDEVCQCNSISGDTMLSYWEYHVFYLQELLEKRIAKNIRFSQQEVWHLIKASLEGYSVLRSNNIYYDFNPSKIVITFEGKVQLFWSHVKVRNAHLAYFEQFNKKSQTIVNYFSPEQLKSLLTNHFNIGLNFQKCNMFSLGMLLFYMMSLVNPLSLYITSNYSINTKSLRSFIHSKIEPYYSQQLLAVLQSCLQLDPSKRRSASELLKNNSKNFQQDSCLNITSGSKTLTQKSAHDSKITKLSLKRTK